MRRRRPKGSRGRPRLAGAAVARPPVADHGRSDRGSVVPFAMACLALLLLVGVALAVVGALVVDHRRAQSAADLGALAGAAASVRGEDGCAAAGRTAAANGARVLSCGVVAGDLRVTVVVPGPRWLGSAGDLRAEARAGPAGP